jgi:hypothetical protein
MVKLHQGITYRGTHKGLTFEVSHHSFESNNGQGIWCAYIYLSEVILENFEQFWLQPTVKKWTEESKRYYVFYDYNGGEITGFDLPLNGGLTFWEQSPDTPPCRWVKFGWDYNHLWDHEGGLGYDARYIASRCMQVIEQLLPHLKMIPA